MRNVDNNEVDKFSRLAKSWWNPNGELKNSAPSKPFAFEIHTKTH